MTTPGTRPARGQRVRYRYHFADFLTGTPLATLPVVDAKLSEVLSGASDGSGVVPLNAAAVQRADPFRATVPRRTCMWAERQVLGSGRSIASVTYPWGGVILGRKRSAGGRGLTLSLVTIPGYFARRIVRTQSYPATTDKFAIARALLDDASAWPQHLRSNSFPDPAWPVDPFVLSGLASGTVLSGDLAERAYEENDARSTLEELEALSRSGDGFDWRMYPERLGDGRFRAALALGYPRLGRIAPADLVWSDGGIETDAGQLLDYTLTEDGSGVSNRLVAFGEGQGPTQLRTEVSGASVGRDEWQYGYPLWESSLRGSSTDLKTQSYLDAAARGALVAGFLSEVTLSGVKIRGDLLPTLDRWNVGDDGTFRIAEGTAGQSTTIVGQIVARTIEPPQQGRPERVTLDVQGAVA